MSDLFGNPKDQFSQNEAQMPQYDADNMANSADPDQTAPLGGLISVYIHCL